MLKSICNRTTSACHLIIKDYLQLVTSPAMENRVCTTLTYLIVCFSASKLILPCLISVSTRSKPSRTPVSTPLCTRWRAGGAWHGAGSASVMCGRIVLACGGFYSARTRSERQRNVVRSRRQASLASRRRLARTSLPTTDLPRRPSQGQQASIHSSLPLFGEVGRPTAGAANASYRKLSDSKSCVRKW